MGGGHSRESNYIVIMYTILLYRNWWNTRIFPFTKKSYLHRAQWRYYFYLSRVRILVSPWLLTYAFAVIEFFSSSLEFWLFGTENISIIFFYFSFITLYPSFITFAVLKMNKNKSCVLCRNFISIYKINTTLHGRLGIQILSSLAESISHSFAPLTRERYFQHSKIKLVSPSGHVISSICLKT